MLRHLLAGVALSCAGCATYVTPDAAAPLDALDRANVAAGSSRQPAPQLPAALAVVRVQASPYRSPTAVGYGTGRFSVLAMQAPGSIEPGTIELARWPDVESAVNLELPLLPEKLDSLDDLRAAAAKMQTDVLMVYTLATVFAVNGADVKPGASLPLGAKPAAPTTITSVATARFVDVRTGFVYGSAQGSETVDAGASPADAGVLDGKRTDAEQAAATALLATAGAAWAKLVQQYR